MRTRSIFPAVLVLAGAVLLGGCAPSSDRDIVTGGGSPPSSSRSAETWEQLARSDVRTVIDVLERVPLAERDAAVMASIRIDRVVFGHADGAQVELPMPDGLAYISFAPYRSQTHECTFHAPTSCVGELRDTELQLTITDVATGEEYVDERTRTFDNGFVGAWLPRGITAKAVITIGETEATEVVSTVSADEATCITTMPLMTRD